MSFDDQNQNPYTANNLNEGPPGPGGGNVASVSDYLVWAIISTLCCCPPLGVVSIIFSALTMGAKSSGNYAVAMQHSKKAKIFLWIAVGLGLAFWTLYILAYVLMFILAAAATASGELQVQ